MIQSTRFLAFILALFATLTPSIAPGAVEAPNADAKPGKRPLQVFILAGETDGRVNPAHSRRMTARLQAATASENPILVRLSAASGHGLGTALSEKIAQQADVFTFLFDQLGMSAK